MLSELIKNSASEGYIKGIDNTSKFVKNTIKSIAKTVESLQLYRLKFKPL